MIERIKPECELGVDEGIDEATAPMPFGAGAYVLVAGTSRFAAGKTVAAAMESLSNSVTQGAR